MSKVNEKGIQSENLHAGSVSWFHSSPENQEALNAAVEGANAVVRDAQQILRELQSLVSLYHGVRVSRYDLVDVARLRRASAEVLADLISCRQCLGGRSRAAAAAARRAARKAS